MKRIIAFLLVLAITPMLFPVAAYAHSGRTDSSGGHYNRSTGKYHYHHGYPAHSHYDIDNDGGLDCPYLFDYTQIAKVADLIEDTYQKGKDDGYNSGYQSGYWKGQLDTGIEYEEKIKEARRDAFMVSALYGAPAVAFVTSLIKPRKTKGSTKKAKPVTPNVDIPKKEESTDKQPDYILVFDAISKISNVPIDEMAEMLYVTVSKAQGKTEAEAKNNLHELLSKKKDNLAPVKSSFISEVSYTSKGLVITFSSGAKYLYYNVPEGKYNEMVSAPSVGKYFHQEIQHKYPYASVK